VDRANFGSLHIWFDQEEGAASVIIQ